MLALCVASSSLLEVRTAAAQQQGTPAAPDLTATIHRIETARGRLETLEAEFDQERVMGLFAQTLRAHGRLRVQRPASVRWEIVTPHPGVFTINGSTVSYSAGGSSAAANQNQIGPLGTVLGDLAAFLGGSLTSLATRYTLTVANADHGALVLTAQPRDPSVARSVSVVRLRFGSDLRVIERIEIEEPGGDRSTIRIISPRVNGQPVALSTP
jgi:outer membrane lipoprotein-sorting protein